jgi:hypothetical protein
MWLSVTERKALPPNVSYALKLEAARVSETGNSLPDYTWTLVKTKYNSFLGTE